MKKVLLVLCFMIAVQLACVTTGPGVSPYVLVKPGTYGVCTQDWRDVYDGSQRAVFVVREPMKAMVIERKGACFLVQPEGWQMLIVVCGNLLGSDQFIEIR